MQTAIANIEKMRRTVPAIRTKAPDLSFFCKNHYKKIERMLVKHVKLAVQHSGLPYEELFGEANYLLVHAMRTFDAGRGVKFTTFLHTCLHNGLIKYGKSLRKHEDLNRVYQLEQDEDSLSYQDYVDNTAERYYSLADFREALSDDESELVELVLLGFVSSLEALKQIAINRLGFENKRFEKTVANIAGYIKEMD